MKKIENFRIVPTADKDGRQREGVCLVGMVDGIETQTSNITRIAPGGRVLLTEKGTKYELGSRPSGCGGCNFRHAAPRSTQT